MAAVIWSFVATAALVMLQVLLISLVGVVLGHFPRPDGLLTRSALSTLSQIMYWTGIPALTLSNFSRHLSGDLLEKTWPLLVWSPIHLIVSGAVGLLMLKLFRTPPSMRRSLLLCTTFQNSVSLPLVVIGAITQQRSELSSDATASTRAVLYIFVYSIPWTLMFWSVGRRYLMLDVPPAQPTVEANLEETTQPIAQPPIPAMTTDVVAQSPASPAEAGTPVVVALTEIEMVGAHPRHPPRSHHKPEHLDGDAEESHSLHELHESDGEADASEAMDTSLIASSAIPSTAFVSPDDTIHETPNIAPTSMGQRDRTRSRSRSHVANTTWRAQLQAVWTQITLLITPPVASIFIGAFIGLNPGVKHFFLQVLFPVSNAVDEIAQPTVMVLNLVMAGSLYHGLKVLNAARSGEAGGQDAGSMADLWRICLAISIARLAVTPMILLATHYAIDQTRIPILSTTAGDADPVLRLVMYTEVIVPSAQVMLTACSQLGLTKAASIIAIAYVFQYLCSIFTMALLMSWIMNLLF